MPDDSERPPINFPAAPIPLGKAHIYRKSAPGKVLRKTLPYQLGTSWADWQRCDAPSRDKGLPLRFEPYWALLFLVYSIFSPLICIAWYIDNLLSIIILYKCPQVKRICWYLSNCYSAKRLSHSAAGNGTYRKTDRFISIFADIVD